MYFNNIANTISFANATPTTHGTAHHLVKEEAEDEAEHNSDGGDRRKIKNTLPEIQERCPDLNLELRISPPHHHQNNSSSSSSSSSYIQPQPQVEHVNYHQHPPLKTGGRNSGGTTTSICFACSLGIENSKECSCTTSLNGTSSSSPSGYDFLGLKTGVLDYRSIEMK
ncbi:hypothetical protein Ccrd_001398 [Cynara cardunculus var. scolymus]|uniref:Uncharacterized protein n=1 Tax=Cynara cardunculus var. scolymus TaxID=59895 RepID=A0A103XTE0_CYNCS|nr:hypothetical protein Ccrd_001398 [Cynara cardunculus var. scolymus]